MIVFCIVKFAKTNQKLQTKTQQYKNKSAKNLKFAEMTISKTYCLEKNLLTTLMFYIKF